MQAQKWYQRVIELTARPRGFHLVTDDIVSQLPEIKLLSVGLVHLFIQHTSASLTINENADASVRHDMEAHFNEFVPENEGYYQHTFEGADDMPAHIKSATVGNHLSLPIHDGRLALGTWQGIYLGEHRNHGGRRRIVATIYGQA